MEIIEATPDNNEELLELCRNTPMRGVLTAYGDRYPDFFQLIRLRGGDWKVWIAKEADKILGCSAQACKKARFRGKEIKVIQAGDLKVHPKARGKQLGVHLSRQIADQGRMLGLPLGEATIIKGNKNAEMIMKNLNSNLDWVHAGYFNIYQVMPYKKYFIKKEYNIRAAIEDDIPAIVNLLNNTYENYFCSPIFTQEYLNHLLTLHPSFNISSFRIAEKDNKIVATAAFWDQEQIRRIVIIKFSPIARFAILTIKVIGKLFGFPKPPKTGESLKYIFLRFPAAKPENIEALRSIIYNETNELRKEWIHQFIWASFHQSDPLASSISKMWKMRMQVNLFYFTVLGEVQLPIKEEILSTPAYADFSLI